MLVLHGFTGNPSSMRGLAEAMAGAGFHVELPRLPGHGTTVEDMMTTGWADWAGEAEAAYARLAERTEHVVVAGLSMGGSLDAVDRPWPTRRSPALVVRQPGDAAAAARRARPSLDEVLAAGTDVMPGIGSDIADPDAHESAYEGMPLRPLLSFLDDGLAPIEDRYGELTMPLLLLTSREDHVVDARRQRVPRRALRRSGRPPLARAQLPRGHAGLRPRRHHPRRGRVRRARSPARD